MALLFLAACGPAAGVRPGGGARPGRPRGAARRRRRRARARRPAGGGRGLSSCRRDLGRRSDRPSRRRRVAFDNFQLNEAALSAERWLALNPTSEQAHRYAGVAALRLHRLDKAEARVRPTARYGVHQPGRRIPRAAAGDCGRGHARSTSPSCSDGLSAQPSEGRRGSRRARQRGAALREFRAGDRSPRSEADAARAVLGAGEDAAGARDDRLGPGRGGARDRARRRDGAGFRRRHAPRVRAAAREHRPRRGGARDAHAVCERQDGRARRGAQPRCDGPRHRRDLDAAEKRFEDLLSTGAQSYEALYYLGVVAERREDADRALRYYSRVVGGDYAMAAQQRVARIKAEQVRRRRRARAPRGIRPHATAARARRGRRARRARVLVQGRQARARRS